MLTGAIRIRDKIHPAEPVPAVLPAHAGQLRPAKVRIDGRIVRIPQRASSLTGGIEPLRIDSVDPSDPLFSRSRCSARMPLFVELRDRQRVPLRLMAARRKIEIE